MRSHRCAYKCVLCVLALMCHSMCYRQLQWVVFKNSTTIFKCMCAFRQRALHTWGSRPQFSPPFVNWDLSFWPTPSHGSGMNVTTIQEILDWGSRGRFLSRQQTCDGRKYGVTSSAGSRTVSTHSVLQNKLNVMIGIQAKIESTHFTTCLPFKSWIQF